MKLIAITQRLVQHESYNEVRETLDINYCKLVRACGFVPIVLPYEVNFKEYFSNVQIHGIILTGGNDLSSCNSNYLSEKRDLYEKELLVYCLENEISILGICRGMQIIAEYFGSTLKRVENQVGNRHKLISNPDSKYFHLLNQIIDVNTYHQFCVDKLSNQFRISATDGQGNIKALEHKSFMIFGQMWHSEREIPFSQSELNLIKEFFK